MAVQSISWNSASLFPQPGRAGQPLQPGRADAGSRAWDGGHREEAEDEVGGNVELMLGDQPGEIEVRESGEGCLLATAPRPSPARRQAAHLSCPAEMLSVRPLRHAAAGTSYACPDTTVVTPSEENPENGAAKRQRCPRVPARLAAQPPSSGQGSQVPSGSSHPPSYTATMQRPACLPCWVAEDGPVWQRVIGDERAQGRSSRNLSPGDPLASPCSVWMFTNQVAP